MKAAAKKTVEDFMTTGVIALRERDTVSEALEDMTLADIHHFPVVDDRGHVVGVISDRDILRGLAHGARMQDAIGALMTRGVRTVPPTTPAHEGLSMMLEGRFSSLPVVGDDGRLVGIVTSRDFLVVAQHVLSGKDVRRIGD
jgi:CBS domain-containing protein